MIILKKDFAAKGIIIAPPTRPEPDREDKETITYDLEINDSYWDPGITTSHSLSTPHTIPANACVLVKTRQVLQIPKDVFGVIASKAKLTTIGLIVANIKIDPSFHGPLTVCLFNASNKPIAIHTGMRCCSIYFQKIDGTGNAVLRDPPEMKPSENGRLVEFYYANKELILGLIAVLGFLISVVTLIVFIIRGNHAP